jgi:radical SAM protein with 4Fe4S-binding SPASM domain
MALREAFIAVTYRCNCRCSMCNIWAVKDHEEIEPHHYSKLPTTLKTINITGGEPFVRGDLREVVRVIHERLPRARMVFSTNGLLTERVISEMEHIRSIHRNVGVGISIDGVEKTHDKIRGIEGLFAHSIATARGLKDRGFRDLRLAMTVQQENAGQIGVVFDIARDIGVEFTAMQAHNSTIYFRKSDNIKVEFEGVPRDAMDYVVESLLRSSSPKDWLRAYHTAGMMDASIREDFEGNCKAGSRYVFIAPNGDVYPCNVMDCNIGNITSVGSWNELFTASSRSRVESCVSECRMDCWMVCNTRSLILSRPLRTGRWVLGRKTRMLLGKDVRS